MTIMLGASVAACQPPSLTPAPLCIMPTAQGAGNGNGWANAGTFASINALIATARASHAEIWVRADAGAYPEQSYSVTQAGTAINPVRILGKSVDGIPMHVPFRGTRSNAAGLIQLHSGAAHLRFSHFRFDDCGLGCFRFRQPTADIEIEDVIGVNVRALILNSAGGGASHATISGGAFRRIDLRGHSKQAIYIRYDSHDILIEDVFADSQQQVDASPWATGIMLNDTAHDIVIRRAEGGNEFHNAGGVATAYWNGDFFSAEKGNYNITILDTVGYGTTDGGIDSKARGLRVERGEYRDSKRNGRFWQNTLLWRVAFRNPHKRGGSGAPYQIWHGGTGMVRLLECMVTDTYGSAVPFYAEGPGCIAVDLATYAAVVKNPSTPMYSLSGNDAQFIVFDPADTTVPVITDVSWDAKVQNEAGEWETVTTTVPVTGNTGSVTIAENKAGDWLFGATRPGILEIVGGADAAQFSVYGRRLRMKKQDYEALPEPKQRNVQLRWRAATDVRSIVVNFVAEISDEEDDPIDEVETFDYPGADGGWWDLQDLSTLWQDTAATIPAVLGGKVARIDDKSGMGLHIIQPDPAQQGPLEQDEDGYYRIWTDGVSTNYPLGAPGDFRFPQITIIMVYERDGDAEGTDWLVSVPRFTAQRPVGDNAVWMLGVSATQTLAARLGSNGRAPGGGAPRRQKLVSSLRSTDGTASTNAVDIFNVPGVASLSYPIPNAQARLFCSGDPTAQFFFKGWWYGGTAFNQDATDGKSFRLKRQFGANNGIQI